MSDAQPPAVVEQSVFATIKGAEQNLHAYLATCPIGGSAAAIGNWVKGLDDYFWRLMQLNPSAERLSLQGFPAAEQYLQAMLRDFASAQQNYVEMYQSAVAIQSRWAGLWRNASQFTFNTISEVIQYRDAVFQNWLQGYFDVHENRCFDCHRPIGIPGGGYCLECALRRRLIY
jgi:hypothetical protein